MRTISDTFLTVMQRKSVSTFLLVKIGPNKDGITYRYTTLPYDYTYEGELYLHDNGLMSLDPRECPIFWTEKHTALRLQTLNFC
jgi:hypothetical protein